jgi:hypothetical protein
MLSYPNYISRRIFFVLPNPMLHPIIKISPKKAYPTQLKDTPFIPIPVFSIDERLSQFKPYTKQLVKLNL